MPLCLMIMLPGMQCCPPDSLRPRNFGKELPRLFVDPPAFLVALHVHQRSQTLTFNSTASQQAGSFFADHPGAFSPSSTKQKA